MFAAPEMRLSLITFAPKNDDINKKANQTGASENGDEAIARNDVSSKRCYKQIGKPDCRDRTTVPH